MEMDFQTWNAAGILDEQCCGVTLGLLPDPNMLLSASAGTEPSPALLVSTSCRRNKRSSSDVPHSSESAPTLCAEGRESSEPSKSTGKKATSKEKASKAHKFVTCLSLKALVPFCSHNNPASSIMLQLCNFPKVT